MSVQSWICPCLEGGAARSIALRALLWYSHMSLCQVDKLIVGCFHKITREVNGLFNERVKADLIAQRMQCSEEQLDNLGT